MKGGIAGGKESDGEGEKEKMQDWLLCKFDPRDARRLGNSEKRKREAGEAVYGMIPDVGSEIQMKELKKGAAKINMSSATLSAHLKDLLYSGLIARRVDSTTYPLRTFYSRLSPFESSHFPAGISEVFAVKDAIIDMENMTIGSNYQFIYPFEVFIDANISSLAASILALIYTSHARFELISGDLEPNLAAKKAVEDLQSTLTGSHQILDKKLDLFIRPWIHKLLDLEIIATFASLPPRENPRLRDILANKGERLIAQALKEKRLSEKILDDYKRNISSQE
jgi:DNA-binding transcriptional ArsR family regulator